MSQPDSNNPRPQNDRPRESPDNGPPAGDDADERENRAARGARNYPHPLQFFLVALVFIVIMGLFLPGDVATEIPYSYFTEQLRNGSVQSVVTQGNILEGKWTDEKHHPYDPAAIDKYVKEKKDKALADAKAKGLPTGGPPGGVAPPSAVNVDVSPAALEAAKVPRLKTSKFLVQLPLNWVNDQALNTALKEHTKKWEAREPTDTANLIFFAITTLAVPGLLIFFMWLMLRRAQNQMSGGGILGNFNKSPARRYEPDKEPITFADVAGLENVKLELQEVVEFLKNPVKFQRLGARVPKGTLLMGPPGTGKTLLAKAVAGEAGVPFFSINGSEFIQMFVGVGASRVRDLFRTAKEAAPCILFVDEIDAVGRMRGAGFGGGHDEREQTLNQILSEMDGFSANEAVIVIAATNRPDVLDPALLRPGRFDRHVTVDRPNVKGRLQQFQVHTRKVPVAKTVDLERLARATVGLTGADIRNLINEAALWATRQGKEAVDMDDFEYARDKILMGPKREEVLLGREKEMTAYHEAGHALLAWLVPGADPVHKVSIIPRGRALGVTQISPEEDRMSITERQLYARLVFMLGGRAAEKIVFDEYNAGAENDLKRATQITRRMVAHWGMSEKIGPVAYQTGEDNPFLGKEIVEQREFSEHSAQMIDEEVARILHEADDKARRMLHEHRESLDKLAHALIDEETIDDLQIEKMIGPSVNRKKRTIEADSEPAAPAGAGFTDGNDSFARDAQNDR